MDGRTRTAICTASAGGHPLFPGVCHDDPSPADYGRYRPVPTPREHAGSVADTVPLHLASLPAVAANDDPTPALHRSPHELPPPDVQSSTTDDVVSTPARGRIFFTPALSRLAMTAVREGANTSGVRLGRDFAPTQVGVQPSTKGVSMTVRTHRLRRACQ